MFIINNNYIIINNIVCKAKAPQRTKSLLKWKYISFKGNILINQVML